MSYHTNCNSAINFSPVKLQRILTIEDPRDSHPTLPSSRFEIPRFGFISVNNQTTVSPVNKVSYRKHCLNAEQTCYAI